MKNLFLLLFLLFYGVGVNAQIDLFSTSSLKNDDFSENERRAAPTQAAFFELSDPAELATVLQKAPADETFSAGEELLLTLPNPDGVKSTFRITRYQLITDELQAVFPSFVTAYGWDVEAPHRKVFLEWTDLGFGASVTGGREGRWYIAPTFWKRTDHYQSYYTRNYPAPEELHSCGFTPNEELRAEIEAFVPSGKMVGDCQLREYDLALACTGEYFAAVGGTRASVVSEMMTAINRVNEVFRADLAITLKIINLPVAGGGIQLIYNDPATDPYTNNNGVTMLGENQTNVDNVIGSANYDIGHVFSTGGGGVASLGSPCNSFVKARGVTGLTNPTGDPFYIDFVAHEIGHQFGGNHTFNSTESNCATRYEDTAYEPGGGTTIQAYAGICGSMANIQLNSDPYYHAISIQEISAYMELAGGASCASVLSTTNTAPSVAAGADYTIPTNTPFVLTAVNGADGDGDALTYCWEQFDLGPVVAGEPTGNEVTGPLFRSLPPDPAPERYFPRLASVVSGTSDWESLPLAARSMKFVVTIRDFGGAGYGCTVQDETDITVVNTGSQYAVTTPDGGEIWSPGATETVTWNVAGTDDNGINCANVDLVLSTDGGTSFTQVLATVPNNGSAAITVPAMLTESARIMIRCSDNIFYDISDSDFSIRSTEFLLSGASDQASVCSGVNEVVFTVDVTSSQAYTGSVDLSIATGLPAGATVAFSTDPVVFNAGNINTTETVTVTIGNLSGAAAGDYTIAVQGDDGSDTKSTPLSLNIGDGPLTLQSPNDNSMQVEGESVDFVFLTIDGLNRYIISYEIYRGNVLQSGGGTGTVYSANPGDGAVVTLSEMLGNMVGDEVRWFVTASDDNNVNPDVVSCTRTYTLVDVLPVNWLDFTARAAGKTAMLNWSVEQDALNTGFAIERNLPGTSNWEQKGYVHRSGPDGIAAYLYTDETVISGNTYHYRLRQEDADGAISYSGIRTVTFEGTEEIILVPNPASNFVLLNAGIEANADLRYTIYSPAGRKVSEGTVNSGQARLDISQLPSAVYQVVVTGEAGYLKVARLIKR
ncbi:T9SS type A sorting domain-containing protein [Neolewinella aurantiaca]|uniref:T9SS type A sorting domain-containing protein n=1 Tax=Neolewinella aurantiaca TaxID=2602767 RepID=A0A5C7FE52_9BACT|nr:zinc-dependent metalloprotease family protein [Neolewinella aurantiaca]TXF88997.1 T9SS type A sorting domain-containing protein [Neolewinella aurantiaca]